MIGDTVNMASRIESMTKKLDAPILVSESVVAHLTGALRLGPPTEGLLKGRAESMHLLSKIQNLRDNNVALIFGRLFCCRS